MKIIYYRGQSDFRGFTEGDLNQLGFEWPDLADGETGDILFAKREEVSVPDELAEILEATGEFLIRRASGFIPMTPDVYIEDGTPIGTSVLSPSPSQESALDEELVEEEPSGSA